MFGRRYTKGSSTRPRRSQPEGCATIPDCDSDPRVVEAGKRTALIFSSATGTPLCRRNLLNRQFRPTAVGLRLKGFNWHWLRHATASLLDAAGAPLGTVQILLGHTSSEVTREHYIHAVFSGSRNSVGRIEELVIGPKSGRRLKGQGL